MGLISTLFSKKSKAAPGIEEIQGMTEREILSVSHRLLGENQNDQALLVLRHAIQLFPQAAAIHNLHHKLRRTVTQPLIDAALKQLSYEMTATTCLHLAELFRQIDENSQALRYGTLAIRAEPESAAGYQLVGRVHLDEFRSSGDSIAGMNAIRYIVKAHGLAPRDSRTLLQLTEIFVILQAPVAARRFLTPVQEAFPQDKTVVDLTQRIADLPPENTSQIQDLFLRYERNVLGEEGPNPTSAKIDDSLLAELQEIVSAGEGVTGFYLVNQQRELMGGFDQLEWETEALGESLGLLVDTAVQNSERMNLGQFSCFSVKQDGFRLMIQGLGQGITAFIFGGEAAKLSELRTLAQQLKSRFTAEMAGGVQ